MHGLAGRAKLQASALPEPAARLEPAGRRCPSHLELCDPCSSYDGRLAVDGDDASASTGAPAAAKCAPAAAGCRQAPVQYFVPIEGYELLEQRSRFTVYKLRVECLTVQAPSFSVYRRFTDFRRLHEKLLRKWPDLALTLDKRGLFESESDPAFLERRQLQLQLFLNALMSDRRLLEEPLVRKFLCLDRECARPTASTADGELGSIGDQSRTSDGCPRCDQADSELDELRSTLKSRDEQIQRLEELVRSLRTQ